MNIKVYSKPACVQCMATHKMLNQLGIDFEAIDLSADAEALREVVALGYQQAPVVRVGDQHWSGFRPDLIRHAALTSTA